jgi:hypothetical protein
MNRFTILKLKNLYMQGSTYTEANVSRDGKTVYIDNTVDVFKTPGGEK